MLEQAPPKRVQLGLSLVQPRFSTSNSINRLPLPQKDTPLKAYTEETVRAATGMEVRKPSLTQLLIQATDLRKV